MGRSFESVRIGIQELSLRWARAGRALKKEDQVYAGELAKMAKKHSSESFYALDDPLEAAVFSVLIELLKGRESQEDGDKRVSTSFYEAGHKDPERLINKRNKHQP
ncbi:Uncharacterised protein [uncultured archaeon]|nr:Uncharacterised protein [uncultured archaeon]